MVLSVGTFPREVGGLNCPACDGVRRFHYAGDRSPEKRDSLPMHMHGTEFLYSPINVCTLQPFSLIDIRDSSVPNANRLPSYDGIEFTNKLPLAIALFCFDFHLATVESYLESLYSDSSA